MDRIYACQVPKKENVMDVHLRPSHFRNQALAQTTLQTIDGNFTMKAPVDDSWGVGPGPAGQSPAWSDLPRSQTGAIETILASMIQ